MSQLCCFINGGAGGIEGMQCIKTATNINIMRENGAVLQVTCAMDMINTIDNWNIRKLCIYTLYRAGYINPILRTYSTAI